MKFFEIVNYIYDYSYLPDRDECFLITGYFPCSNVPYITIDTDSKNCKWSWKNLIPTIEITWKDEFDDNCVLFALDLYFVDIWLTFEFDYE